MASFVRALVLLTMASMALSQTTITSYTGFLADLFCVNMANGIAVDGANMRTDPASHTVACMIKLSACYTSGFAILENVGNSTNPSYVAMYILDAASNAMAINLLNSTQAIDNYLVTVSGLLNTTTSLLSLSSISETYPVTAVTSYTGFLADVFCVNMPNGIAVDGANMRTDPAAHTVACMIKLSACYTSGFYILQNIGNANAPNYTAKYALSAKANELAIALLNSTNAVNNYSVTVSGVVNSQTPIGILSLTSIVEVNAVPPPPPPGPPAPSNGIAGYTNSVPIIPGVLTLYSKPLKTTDTTIDLALVGPNSGFVAVGWSPNGMMLNSDAVVGWSNGASSPTINDYLLPNEMIPSTPGNLSLSNVAATVSGGTQTLLFTRLLSSGKNPITSSGNIIIGSIGSSKQLAYHKQHSLGIINANFYTGAVSSKTTFGFPQAHGLIMFVSWGILLTFGMLWARYARHLPNAIWFKVHRVTQYTGFVLSLAGVILILSTTKTPFGMYPHHIVGIIITILSVAQVVVAFFRPHKSADQPISVARIAFEYFHWWNGRILVLLVVYQVISGIGLLYQGYNGLSLYLVIVYGALVGVVILIIVGVEIFNCVSEDGKFQITPCFKFYGNSDMDKM